MKALVTVKFKPEEFKKLENLGYEIIFRDEKSVSFTEDIKDIDILVGFNPFTSLDIDLFPNLKWIQLMSAGINQIPVNKVNAKNILVTNNRGGYSVPIAEWTVLKILEMIKNSKEFYNKQQEKSWKVDMSLLELFNKTICFIGTGSIAEETAKRLEAFGVNIIGINSSGKKVDHFHKCYSIDEIHTILPDCDFVVIATPYTEKTHHLVDEKMFNSMKDGVYLVNIARGSIIDEKVLVDNLKSGKIKKAALDVFEVEPLSEDSPLWEMDNVILSPHNCWVSEMYNDRRYYITHTNMEKYINNKELVNKVNINQGY